MNQSETGDIRRYPGYGPLSHCVPGWWTVPVGDRVVMSCALLHLATGRGGLGRRVRGTDLCRLTVGMGIDGTVRASVTVVGRRLDPKTFAPACIGGIARRRGVPRR